MNRRKRSRSSEKLSVIVVGYSIALFFFSGRRRHTRSLCDWSSDVCSSDLSEEGTPSRNFRFFDNRQKYLLFVNTDRKSTRLNSSHTVISYAVFCLKKKK